MWRQFCPCDLESDNGLCSYIQMPGSSNQGACSRIELPVPVRVRIAAKAPLGSELREVMVHWPAPKKADPYTPVYHHDLLLVLKVLLPPPIYYHIPIRTLNEACSPTSSVSIVQPERGRCTPDWRFQLDVETDFERPSFFYTYERTLVLE